MILKERILKQRIRKILRSFSWVEQRLVRERHIDNGSHNQAAQ